MIQGAGVGAQLVQTKYGRDAELEADEYGMKYMKNVGLRHVGRRHPAGIICSPCE